MIYNVLRYMEKPRFLLSFTGSHVTNNESFYLFGSYIIAIWWFENGCCWFFYGCGVITFPRFDCGFGRKAILCGNITKGMLCIYAMIKTIVGNPMIILDFCRDLKCRNMGNIRNVWLTILVTFYEVNCYKNIR